jgi:cell division protein FtsL
MDDSRTDAPKFDLTAQPSEDEDVLQAEPTDLALVAPPAQKKKPEIKPTPPNAELDAKLFNALVSPVAPVHLSERSVSARPSPQAVPAEPAPAAPPEARVVESAVEPSSHTSPVAIEVHAVEPDPEEAQIEVTFVDIEPTLAPEVAEAVDTNSDPSIFGPIPLQQPIEVSDSPTVHDWEPLPPLMRIVAGHYDPDDQVPDADPVSTPAPVESVDAVEAPQDERRLTAATATWDPAAVEDPPTLIASADVLDPTPAPPEPSNTAGEPDDAAGIAAEGDDAEVGVHMLVAVQAHEPMPDPEPLLAASPADLGPSPAVNAPAAPIEQPGRTGAWWTLPIMCLGLAIVACAVLVPAADENRRDLHELAKLERDVAYFQKQSDVNQQFLEHVSTDPTLAERLAQRQLRMTRVDSRVVQMSKDRGPFSMSPYALVTIDPPTPMPEYRPMGGFLSRYFLDTKGQIYLTGLGILLVAAGVILGGGEPRKNV